MNEINDTIKKIYKSKIDIPAMVNNAVLFILAWICAYWFFNFFTLLPAFSLGVKMLIYNSFIDFNSVNTAASDKDLWSSADNINTVFFTPVIFSVILALTAVLFLIKWNSDRLNMRRFLFWLILCLIIRINGNFIFGQLFHLWSWNLVTDFMGLTYPSTFLKYTVVIIVFIITAVLFIAMTKEIKKLFNPYLNGRFNNLISNIFLPVLIGCIFLALFNLPYLPANEIGCLLMMLFCVSFFMCRPFLFIYRGTLQEQHDDPYDEKINLLPLGILTICCIADIILIQGVLLENSAYRFFFIENTIMFLIIAVAVITLIISIRVYNKRANARKKAWEKQKAEIDYMNYQSMMSGEEDWETKNKINLDKYSHFLQAEDSKQEENDNEEPAKIDFANSQKYGFKRYDLSKYNKRNW